MNEVGYLYCPGHLFIWTERHICFCSFFNEKSEESLLLGSKDTEERDRCVEERTACVSPFALQRQGAQQKEKEVL